MFLFLQRELPAYCGRVGDSWLAEPLNLFTALLLAAPLMYGLRRRRRGEADGALFVLTLIVGVLLVAQLMVHGMRPSYGVWLDELPFGAFAVVVLFVIAKRYLGLGAGVALLNIVGFVLLALAYRRILPHTPLGAAAGVAPPVLAVTVLGGLVLGQGWEDEEQSNRSGSSGGLRRARALLYAGKMIIAAGLLLGVGLLARGLDDQLCPYLPFGLHAVWHVCKAAVLLLLLMAVAEESAAARGRGA